MSKTEYDTGKLWIDDRPFFGIVVDLEPYHRREESRLRCSRATVLVNGYTKGTLVDTVTTLHSICIGSSILRR